MKKIKIASAVTLVLISAGIYLYNGLLFKSARDIQSEEASVTIEAKKLASEYASNPQKADSLYLNKTIEITGLVTKETDSVLVLENAVFCLLSKREKVNPEAGKVVVKGKCIGYDELFEEVKLDQCTINKPNKE